MKLFDVFIRDGREYGGGFEIRVPAATESEARAEALNAANAEFDDRSYDGDDIGSVGEVTV
jgi:hypothetical protein